MGGEGPEWAWPGPGLTSQQLFQRLWASRYRLALRGPRVSQRVGAGTCSAHTLSAGDALHGRAGGSGSRGRPPPHPRGPTLEPPRWPSMGSSEPLLQPHLPILLITSASWKNAPWDLGVSVLFPTAFPLPGNMWAYLAHLTDSRLLLVCHRLKPSQIPRRLSAVLLECPATLEHTSS